MHFARCKIHFVKIFFRDFSSHSLIQKNERILFYSSIVSQKKSGRSRVTDVMGIDSPVFKSIVHVELSMRTS